MADAQRDFVAADPDAPIFVISIAAELSGMHPQTLRGYDRLGIVRPGRTGGGGRRYSVHDIEQLRIVSELTSAGIGIEGVRRILALERELDDLRTFVVQLQQQLATAHRLLMEALPTNLPMVRGSSAVTPFVPPGRPFGTR